MTNIIAERLQNIKPSATIAISAKASELRSQGIDVISLAAGEPDFSPPAHVITAAKKAIDDGFHYYTPVDGLVSLKQAIIKKLKHDNQLSYELNQIIVSTGAKQSIYNVCQAILNPGDEVIIPAPYWVSYPDMVRLTEATPVIIETNNNDHYKLTAKQLEAAITNKTKMLILNSPSNPTGMVYSEEELSALAKVLLKNPQVIILTDDIYEHICWAESGFQNIITVCPELYNQSIIINGVSKAYAMTGWRIGYAAGPEPIIKAMKKLQSQSTSNPNAVAQKAAEEALLGDQTCLTDMVNTYKQRQQFMLDGINAMKGFHCQPTEGAFYLFVDVKIAINRLDLKDDVELASYILDKAQVAMVPGTAFGSPGHLRLSYATSDNILQDALQRLQKLFN